MTKYLVRVKLKGVVVCDIHTTSRYDAKKRRLRLVRVYPDHEIEIVGTDDAATATDNGLHV